MSNEKDNKNVNSQNEDSAENVTENKTSEETQDTEENIQQNQTETKDSNTEEKSDEKSINKKAPKKKSKKFKNRINKSKIRRRGISSAFTAGFIVIVVLINIIVGTLSDRFPSMNVDLTQESMNTLSQKACEIVDKVNVPTKIYILATEAQTKGDFILAEYGIKYSQVGELVSKIAEKNKNITYEYVDLDKKPTFATEYKNDNIMVGDVIIKTDKRYRVLTYTDLFDIRYNQEGTGYDTFSMVDSALSSGLSSVVADTISVAAFDTAHSEAMDVTAYKNLLKNNSFETKEINLLTDEISKDVKLLVLGCPSTDFTKDEINKMDNFLKNTSVSGDRSALVTFDPAQKDMPNLSEFLKEWGISSSQSVIVESDRNKHISQDPTFIFSDLQSEPKISSGMDYGYYITPRSKPLSILYETKGTRKTYSLSKSSDTCILVDNNTKEGDNPPKAAYNTGVLSQDVVKSGDKEYKSNVIALGSTLMFNPEYISASTFGNSKYIVDISKYGTGMANETTSITQVPVQTNVADITLSAGMSVFLGIGIFTLLIPLMIAVAGIYMYRKRRHL